MKARRWQAVRARLVRETPALAGPDIWTGIQTAREQGRRPQLPVHDARVRPAVVVAIGGAALAALVLTLTVQPGPVVNEVAPVTDPWGWLVRPAMAQTVATSTLRPVATPNLARVAPGRFVYARSDGVDGIITSPTVHETIEIAQDSIGGLRRLAVVQTRARSVDSLILSRDSSRLLRLVAYSAGMYGPASRRARYEFALRPDTLVVDLYPAKGGAPRAHLIPVARPVMLDVVLIGVLPGIILDEHYARSLNLLDLLGGETTIGRPFELRVAGRKTVRTAAGKFDCWLVDLLEVDSGSGRTLTHRLKVDRVSGIVVQARWESPSGFFREIELVSRSSASSRG